MIGLPEELKTVDTQAPVIPTSPNTGEKWGTHDSGLWKH
jgi:hypothetical protein